MKKVVIYPGRFQPMLPHHAEVYKKLQATFPDAEVYVATSDKVDGGKSPFNFKEKAEVMQQLHEIPADKIILAPQPYLIDSYKKSFNQENTMVIFAVGEKDGEERFPMKNVDEITGLDMTVRGEPRPKYYQKINTLKQHPAQPMSERGYIYIAPNVGREGEVASASAFRNAFTSVGSEQGQKEVFEKYFGKFNQNIFALFKNKILGDTMKEELDILKRLAGLQVQEAPVNFDMDNEVGDDEEDYKPGFTQDNMINQLGKIIDSEEAGKDAEAMKIKKFTPVTSVQTDDGKTLDISPAEAKALKKMFNMLPSQRGGEEKSPREKFQSAIQNSEGLENMLAFAKKKGMIETVEQALPQLDLSDIRGEYDVEEGSGEEHFCQICAGNGCKECDDTGIAKEYQDESAPFGEPSQQDMMADKLSDAYQQGGEEGLCKAAGCTLEELDQEINEICREKGLHPDDDRDECIQIYIEDLVDNADYKDHGEYESIEEAMCGCCGNDPCDCPKDCKGCMEESADLEQLKKLAGI